MTASRIYSVDNINIRVQYEDVQIADHVTDLLKALGFRNGKRAVSKPKIKVKFTSANNQKIKNFSKLTSLHSFGVLEFFQDNDYLYVTDGNSFLGVKLRTNTGLVIIHESFWQKPLFLKASLLIIGFILLLWQYDFHELHAAGLAEEGKGLLIVGPTGSGKSSLTLSLVQAGWNYLTDDMLIFRHTNSAVEAFPLRRYFKIDKAIGAKYPKLKPQLDNPLEQLENEAYIYIDEIYDNQLTQKCVPRLIIFPKITHKETSFIEPIKRSDAFINLFQTNCYGMFFDKHIARRRIDVIKELVYQADCYQMSVGLDLYENPEKIIEFLPW
ncbi:MAG: hypothetical protein ACREOW_11500 [Thermodesulfobacteriota bacterium]